MIRGVPSESERPHRAVDPELPARDVEEACVPTACVPAVLADPTLLEINILKATDAMVTRPRAAAVAIRLEVFVDGLLGIVGLRRSRLLREPLCSHGLLDFDPLTVDSHDKTSRRNPSAFAVDSESNITS